MATMPMTTFAELERLGKWIAGCGETFGCPTDGHGLMIALECHATGTTPFAWLRRYGLLHGRPSMKADAMLADFQVRGGKWKVVERSAKRAAVVFTYEGQETPFEFTLEQAVKAGYTVNKNGTPNKQWATIPENMLFARCVSGGLRIVCPMIVAGYYTPEELNDEGEEQTQAAPVAELPPALAKVAAVAAASMAAGKEQSPTSAGKGQAAVAAAPVAVATAKSEVVVPSSGPIPADASVPAELQPATPATPVAVDYGVCPIGTAATKGKPWRELPDAVLARCLTAKDGVFVAVTVEHKAAIEEEVSRRQAAKAQPAPAQA